MTVLGLGNNNNNNNANEDLPLVSQYKLSPLLSK